jgi:HTH-type transcriptional regulator, sugar sensing transcriptional regulator
MQSTKEVELTLFNSDPGSNLYEYKQELDKINDELLKFGLTPNQTKVFMYLGKYGSKTSPEVCNALKLPRTETYNVLNALLNRGIIISEFQHPTRYTALSMDKAILTMVNAAQENVNNLAKKEIEIAKLWNKIPSFTDDENETHAEKFQMLQGTTRIHNKMKEMLTNTKNEFKILCSENDLSKFYYTDFLEILGSLPSDLKLIISPTKKIPRYIRAIDETKIRILPNNNVENQCFLVKDNDEVLIYLRNNERTSRNVFAFWTNTGSLVRSMRNLFQYSWQNSLPLDFEKFIEKKYNYT